MKFNSLFTHNVKSVLHELCTALYYVPLCKCFYKDSEDDGKKILKLRYSSISIQHRTKGGEKLCCFVFIAEPCWSYYRKNISYNFLQGFRRFCNKKILKIIRQIISIPFRLLQHIYFPTSCVLKNIAEVMKVYVAICKVE